MCSSVVNEYGTSISRLCMLYGHVLIIQCLTTDTRRLQALLNVISAVCNVMFWAYDLSVACPEISNGDSVLKVETTSFEGQKLEA